MSSMLRESACTTTDRDPLSLRLPWMGGGSDTELRVCRIVVVLGLGSTSTVAIYMAARYVDRAL